MKGNVCKPEYDGKIVLSRGLVFEYVDHFRSVLKDIAVQSWFAYRLIKK